MTEKRVVYTKVTPEEAQNYAPDPKRGYVKVTSEMEMQVVAYKTLHPLDSYAAMSEELDLPKRTIEYILIDLPRLRRIYKPDEVETTTKQRILAALSAIGVFDNVTELRRVLGRSDDNHNLVHLLHSLHKEGKVEFRESNGKEPTAIRLTARGKGQGLKKNGEPTAQEETTAMTAQPEVQASFDIEPEDATQAYPLLDALLLREKERLEKDGKAMAYVNAAEALASTDDREMYDMLMAKAAEFDVVYPSPIEAEYLRWVANHAKETK
jgi:hypothetical protein